MSVMNPISSNIFNAEFLNTPAAALAAWISIIGAVRVEFYSNQQQIDKKIGILSS